MVISLNSILGSYLKKIKWMVEKKLFSKCHFPITLSEM